MRILIDADILRYQIGAIKASHPYIKGEYIPAPETEIVKLVDDLIRHVIKINKGDSYICALSGKGNFRNDVAVQQEYKGNRDPNTARPFHYETVEKHIVKHYNHIIVDGIEADDWMAIEQRNDPDNTLIATRDKDMWTCFGWHYRWACGDRQPEVLKHWVPEFESKLFFFQQMLTGDNTDNIPGCGIRREVMWGGKLQLRRKGVGEATAIKLLDGLTTVREMFDVVSAEYKKVFGENYEEVMLEQARLLYIGQTADNLFSWDWLNYELSKDTDNGEVLSGDVSECESGSVCEHGESGSGELCTGFDSVHYDDERPNIGDDTSVL